MKKKRLSILLISCAIVVSVFAAVFFVMPRLIHFDFVRNRIYGYVSTETGGSLEYKELSLSFFPRPGLTIHDASLVLPSQDFVHLKSATITPHLRALLSGDFRTASLTFNAPSAKISIPAKGQKDKPQPERNDKAVLENLGILLGPLAKEDLTFLVQDGSLSLHHGDRNLFQFDNIYCRITNSGGVSEIRLESESSLWEQFSFQGRLQPEAYRLEGHVKVSRFMPGAVESYFLQDGQGVMGDGEMEFQGDVIFSDGILEGKGLNAEMDGKTVKNGLLKLDLFHEKGVFQLDVEAAADLARLFPFLERLLGQNSWTREFVRVNKMEGRAEGRVILNGTTVSFKTTVDVPRFHLRAVYPPIPHPIWVKSGQFHYDDAGMAVKNLTGDLGKSTFSQLDGALKWNPEPHLSLSSGRLGIVLDEIYPWIAAAAGLKEDLIEIQKASGRLDLAHLTFDGPLFRPESWKIQGGGTLKDVRVVISDLPEPILLSQGNITADSDDILLKNADMVVSDCRLLSDITFQGYRSGIQAVLADFTGSIGPKMTSWVLKKEALSETLQMRTPLTFAPSHIHWEMGAGISVDAEATSSEGVNVSLGLKKSKRAFELQRLVISDGVSSGSFQLTEADGTLDAGFSGSLNKDTLDKLLLQNSLLTGKIEGDFKAHVPLKEPRESDLFGNLQGQNLDLTALNIPLKILEISLKTDEKTIDLETMRFLWEEEKGSCTGRIIFSEKDILADLNLSMNALDWKSIETLTGNPPFEGVPPGKKKGLPVQGMLRIALGKFMYKSLTWEPLHAEMKVEGENVGIEFSETRICGIETPGRLSITPNRVGIDLKLLAEKLPINPTSTCLTKQEIDGTFSLEGTIESQGKAGELMKGVNGELNFRARDGKINRSSIWTNIFDFLSIRNLLTGGFTHFKEKGFHFSDARAKAVLKGSILQLEEGTIYGDAMDIAFEGNHDILSGELDLTLLIAPFTTANWIVRHIPIVNYLMDGTIGTIPVKVTGNIDDPKVTALPLSAVGSELLGVLERTISAPLTAVESLDAEKKKKELF